MRPNSARVHTGESVIKIFHQPMQRSFWCGDLPLNLWYDTMGMYEARICIEGLAPGEVIIIQGSVADKTGDDNACEIKRITENGELVIKGYRWYRALKQTEVSANVRVHFYGSN